MERVVITGVGAVTPVGNDVPQFWDSLVNGVCGIAPITRFDTADFKVKVAAEVKGFDPTKYAGTRVKRYSYRITNYPTGEEGVVADLYIYKNTVIGGEVLNPQLDGFLHGLNMPI